MTPVWSLRTQKQSHQNPLILYPIQKSQMKSQSIFKYFPYFLFFYHLGFAWFAYDYVNQNNGDAVRYWFVGRNMENLEWISFLKPGTDFVKFLSFPFVKFLHFPGWAGCLLFSALSGIGFLKLWALGKKIASHSTHLMLLFMFFLLLPNAHFWTSIIGKEALLFLPVVCIVEKIYKKEFFAWAVFLSFFVIAWIRPHMAFVFLCAYVLAILGKGEFSIRIKTGIGAAAVLGAGILYYLLVVITQSKISLLQKIENLYAAHNFKLKGTSGYVPLEEYSYPYKMFTFYLRPFPFEKSGFYYHVLSFENLIFFILFLIVLYVGIRNFKRIHWTVFYVFSILVLLIYGTIFAYGYANFGMIARTKTMVIPVILILGVSLLKEIWTKGKKEMD